MSAPGPALASAQSLARRTHPLPLPYELLLIDSGPGLSRSICQGSRVATFVGPALAESGSVDFYMSTEDIIEHYLFCIKNY